MSVSPIAPTTWNTEESKKAKLFVPQSYDPYQNQDAPRLCYVDFDKTHNVLVLIAEDTQETLDIIDPADVIGASVEISFLDSPNNNQEPRATAAFRNDEQTSSSVASVSKGGIFEPLLRKDNNDKIFTVVSNEPKSPIPSDTQATAVLNIYVYPRKDPSSQSIITCAGNQGKCQPVKEFPRETSNENHPQKLLERYPHHRRFQVAPAEDFAFITALVKEIRKLARPNHISSTPERLLILINPFAGRKKGFEVYNTIVVPMLEEAGIDHDYMLTTYAGQAMELMAQRDTQEHGIDDIAKYDGLVAIGGDGSVYEIMQGIKKRSDCDAVLKKIKLGHIGAGTSNGLSASLAHASQECMSAMDYAFMVAKGNTVNMDLSRYETKSAHYLSFLTFSWAFIADVDIESEVLRWMGFLRNDVYAVWRLINLRSYKAKLSYLKPGAGTLTALPPLSEPLPTDKGWTTMEAEFYLFWASQVTHAGEQLYNHPQCKPDDGLFHILLIRKPVSRFRLLLILLSLEHGGHVGMDSVEFLECTAYRLEPAKAGSFNDLDGEVVEAGPIQGMVLPGAIRAYCNL